MIRAILLDLDGTLFDKVAVHRRYCEDFMARHPHAFPERRRAKDLDELAFRSIVYWSRFGFARMVRWKYPAIGLRTAEIAEDYARQFPRFIEPDPAVIRLVADLSRRFTVAVLTNGSSRLQRAKLERVGLGTLADRAYISGETGRKKPGAEAYLRPLDDLGCPPEAALMVGDHEIQDVRGAYEVGMPTCWVSGGSMWVGDRFPGSRFPKPDWIIEHVLDLPKVLP